MRSFLQIPGNRINLRTLREADAPLMQRYASDFSIARYTSLPHPYALKDAVQFIRLTQRNIRKRTSYELAIERKDGILLGVIGLTHIDFEDKNGEMGYWLARRFWRKGYMNEAVDLLLRFAFHQLGLVRVYARVMHPNVASARLLQQKGFTYEGRLRKSCWAHGKWMDNLVYALLREEWKKGR